MKKDDGTKTCRDAGIQTQAFWVRSKRATYWPTLAHHRLNDADGQAVVPLYWNEHENENKNHNGNEEEESYIQSDLGVIFTHSRVW
jgi:hypothetical protein